MSETFAQFKIINRSLEHNKLANQTRYRNLPQTQSHDSQITMIKMKPLEAKRVRSNRNNNQQQQQPQSVKEIADDSNESATSSETRLLHLNVYRNENIRVGKEDELINELTRKKVARKRASGNKSNLRK